MSYAIKAYKELSTLDGVAFTANLYRDGKKVAVIENRGDGGPTYVRWNDRATENSFAAEFVAWVSEEFADHEMLAYGKTEENAAETIIDVYEMNRLSKTSVVLDLSTAGTDGFRLRDIRTLKLKDPSHRSVAVTALASQYPACEVWVPNLNKWLPISDIK